MTDLQDQPADEILDRDLDHEDGFEPAQDGSILGNLRALRERRAQRKAPMRDLTVPGYDGRLLVRYRYPEGGYEQAIKLAQRETRETKDARLNAAADLLVACCGSVLGRRTDGVLVDLLTDHEVPDDELPPLPLRFDRSLAQQFQIDVPPTIANPARFVTRCVFSPRGLSRGEWDGDLMLITQSNQVWVWLNGVARDIDEDVAGE